MSGSNVKNMMASRLVRGTQVVVADSFDKAQLRGRKLVVVSKQPVPCKGGSRCAGPWCVGLAAFVADAATYEKDRKGWREGATKICLTHLMDKDGDLLLPPPVVSVAQAALEAPKVVTWEDLANAAADQDMRRMVVLARALKRENEHLTRQVVEVQNRLIEQYQPE